MFALRKFFFVLVGIGFARLLLYVEPLSYLPQRRVVASTRHAVSRYFAAAPSAACATSQRDAATCSIASSTSRPLLDARTDDARHRLLQPIFARYLGVPLSALTKTSRCLAAFAPRRLVLIVDTLPRDSISHLFCHFAAPRWANQTRSGLRYECASGGKATLTPLPEALTRVPYNDTTRLSRQLLACYMLKHCSEHVFRWCLERGAIIFVCRENDGYGQRGPHESALSAMIGLSYRMRNRLIWSVNSMLERDVLNAHAPMMHAFVMGEMHANARDAGADAWPLTRRRPPRTIGYVQAPNASADVYAALSRVARAVNLTFAPRCFYTTACQQHLRRELARDGIDHAQLSAEEAHNVVYPRGIEIAVQWPARMRGHQFYWYTLKAATKSVIWWPRGIPLVAYQTAAYADYECLFGYNLVADSFAELERLVRALVVEPACAAHYARLGRLLAPYFAPHQRSVELFEAALCHFLYHFDDEATIQR